VSQGPVENEPGKKDHKWEKFLVYVNVNTSEQKKKPRKKKNEARKPPRGDHPGGRGKKGTRAEIM